MPPSRYSRKSKCRIPIKFYIAPEGTVTEYDYFSSLQRELRLENVEIIPIPKEEGDTCSDPEHIVKLASKFCTKHKIKIDDYFKVAIVVDFDRWRHKLANAFHEAKRRKFDFYLSNPCIELWFLLHENDLSTWDKSELTPCRKCKQLFGSSNKIKTLYINTKTAIENARKLDNEQDAAWPTEVGTSLYKLFEQILNLQ